MARHSLSQAFALAISIVLGLTLLPGPAAAGPSTDSAPAATAYLPPFPLPLLEGPQVKVEIGAAAPNGPAMTFVGGQNAFINFSVWFWDAGPASEHYLWLDQSLYTMDEVPGQDGIYENGTVYRKVINATDLGTTPGEHTWNYTFVGPSGRVCLPACGTQMGNLSLDSSEMFLDQSLVLAASQTLASGYSSGTLSSLRAVVQQAVNTLDPRMSSDWDGTEVPYNYIDDNHNITGPVALAVNGPEVFVGSNGLQLSGFGDGGLYPGNSQPAHKQALALRGLLLASGLFNESDLVMMSDAIDVNGTTFFHPYLRVALHDGSEQPGDGTADNDTFIDVDLWGGGLANGTVDFGKHFGSEDNDTSDDVPWNPSVGWPPVNDSLADLVVWPTNSTYNVTTPSGTPLSFHILKSTVHAQPRSPVSNQIFWKDEPIVFDALASTQTMFEDMRYTWSVTGAGINGAGPVWVWYAPVSMLGTQTVVLTVTDVNGDQSSVSIQFIIAAKTQLHQPIPNGTFDEDSFLPFDLRGYFSDEDGFNTIDFTISVNRSEVFYDRVPATAPNLTFRALPNWCGPATVSISATDGLSPPVNVSFSLTVRCLNDPPVITGIPTIINFTEDGQFILPNLSRLATDPDVGDTINWSMDNGNVYMTLDLLNDTMVFRATHNWFGQEGHLINASDGHVNASWFVTFIVTPVNDPPYQNRTIPLQTIAEDTPNVTLSLDYYFADPDDNNFQAELTPDAGLVAGYFAPLRQMWFHPVANYSGPTGFSVRVFDPAGASVTVHVDVQVTPVNDPPEVVGFEPQGPVTGTEGDLLIFVVQVVDSDSPILTYTFKVDGVPIQTGTSATFEWQTDFQDAGFHNIEAVASDPQGASDSHTWQVQLANQNRAPSVTIQGLEHRDYEPGEQVNLTAAGTDPDGDPLIYEWTFGGVLQPMQGQNISFNFSSAGNYTVKVTASDSEATASASALINVTFEPPPPPPPCNGTACEGGGNNSSPFLTGPEPLLPIAAAGFIMALFARRRRRRPDR